MVASPCTACNSVLQRLIPIVRLLSYKLSLIRVVKGNSSRDIRDCLIDSNVWFATWVQVKLLWLAMSRFWEVGKGLSGTIEPSVIG